MIAFLVKLTVLFAAGWAGAALLRSQAAALRHLVWAATLVASLALAVLLPLLPSLELPLPGIATPALVLARSATGAPAPGMVSESDRRATSGDADFVPDGPAIDAATEAPPSPRALLLAAWLTGAIGVGAWWMLGHVGLARLTARARPVTSAGWRTLLRELRAAGGPRAEIELRSSADVGSPLVWGVRRPVILLPDDADDWSADRRRAVLAHELAHVARRDGLVNALGCMAAALYWFHPLAWIALHRLRVESERACDDRVLARGISGTDYAADLLEVARGARALRLAGLSAIGMARPTHLEGRLLAVLDERRPRGEPALRNRILLASAFLLGVPLLAASRVVLTPPADAPLRVAAADAGKRNGVIERTLPAADGERLTLELETGASVSVRGWKDPSAKIRVRLDGEEDDTRVDVARVADGVRVHMSLETRKQITSTSHELEVMVPERYDVRLDSAGGDVSLSDLHGRFEGTTGGGTLTLSKVSGDADLRTGGGDIRVSDSELSGNVRTGGGSVVFTNVSKGLHGSSGSGPVIYHEAADDGVGGAKDRLHFSLAGGDIELDEIANGADLETGGGDIRVQRARGYVDASTGGGKVEIRHVTGGVSASTGAGDVHIGVDELTADGRGITVGTGNGDVVIELPADVAATLALETAYTNNLGHRTRIESDWDLAVSETDDWDDRRGTPRKYVRASGDLGGGGPRIEVNAVNGDIRVIRR
jgi:beta-lactamase regulating signal transducer with metallopeptidase domain